jgi:quercetin dioxygenase-like cupin family protein
MADPRPTRLEHAMDEAFAAWFSAQVEPIPSAMDRAVLSRTRERLLGALSTEQRFRPFFVELDRVFAVGVEALCALLRRIDDPSSYQTAPMQGVRFFHFAPSSASGFAEAGIVRLAKGVRFPRHRHLGDEINFVLEGALIDGGIAYGPGSAICNPAGSEHDYSAGETRDLVLMAGHSGIAYLGDNLQQKPTSNGEINAEKEEP